MFKLRFLIVLLMMLLFGQVSLASTVRLVTIGPGDAFWSAFGHTAIAIDDDVYAFGYFSFDDDMISSFLNNRMFYDSGRSDLNQEISWAKQQNRDFSVVELDLSASEKQEIADYLMWHNLPENKSYQYDYFLNNCSTKIRDVLDNVWNHNLKNQSEQINKDSLNSSYFEQTFPAKHQGLMNFGLALGYGWSAYTAKNAWELMALPVYFERYLLAEFNQKLKPRQLIVEAVSLSPTKAFLKTHWFLISYTLIWTVLLLIKNTRFLTSSIWFYWHGIIGLILSYLWFLTPHLAMDWNFNVLLLSPLGLLLPKFKILIAVVAVGILIWFVMAISLGAWYLMPLLLPATLAIKNRFQAN